MFGMLDYRAHKLLWLLVWPVRLLELFLSYALLIGIALYARFDFSSYHPMLLMAGAWIGGQIAMMLLGLVFMLAVAVIRKVFFWVIDVVPAHGENADEAQTVVTMGPIYALNKKLEWNIDEWTDEDTDALVRCSNWRARWFFPIRQRTQRFVDGLQRLQRSEGSQPAQWPATAISALRNKVGKPSWFEIAVVNPYAFHAILGLAITVLTIFWGR